MAGVPGSGTKILIPRLSPGMPLRILKQKVFGTRTTPVSLHVYTLRVAPRSSYVLTEMCTAALPCLRKDAPLRTRSGLSTARQLTRMVRPSRPGWPRFCLDYSHIKSHVARQAPTARKGGKGGHAGGPKAVRVAMIIFAYRPPYSPIPPPRLVLVFKEGKPSKHLPLQASGAAFPFARSLPS